MADELIERRLRDPCVDWTGEQIVDNSTPRHEIECGLLREAATRIETLEREIAEMREILSFDCTAFPGMEEAAIKWANKISGERGGKPYHPDPVGILEMCEDIARQALNRGGAE